VTSSDREMSAIYPLLHARYMPAVCPRTVRSVAIAPAPDLRGRRSNARPGQKIARRSERPELTEVGVGVSHPRQPKSLGLAIRKTFETLNYISARKGQSDWTRKRLRTLGSVFIGTRWLNSQLKSSCIAETYTTTSSRRAGPSLSPNETRYSRDCLFHSRHSNRREAFSLML